MVDVSRGVICAWRVVCGERGRGIESCWGWSVGETEVEVAALGSDGACAGVGGSEDGGMMRGISRFYNSELNQVVDTSS